MGWGLSGPVCVLGCLFGSFAWTKFRLHFKGILFVVSCEVDEPQYFVVV